MSRFAYVNKHKLVTPKGGVRHKPFRTRGYDQWVNKSFGAMIKQKLVAGPETNPRQVKQQGSGLLESKHPKRLDSKRTR